VLGSGAELVGGVLAAGGWACQHRPARSLHLGVVGERGSHYKGRSPARPGASPELAQVTEGGADRRVRQERGRAVESIAMTLAQ